MKKTRLLIISILLNMISWKKLKNKTINIIYIYLNKYHIIYLKCFVFVLLNPENGISLSSFFSTFGNLQEPPLNSSWFLFNSLSSSFIGKLLLILLLLFLANVQSEREFAVLSKEQQFNKYFYK